ncbi:hypothetical protein B0H17DRAFT_676249 [Mycena rosella]|uniref:Uncharacterized protein n=1 Tax=Mycena rosella TaxID=1033263 RepID=A0AAD7DCA1_MYCRO|nr:hypothetical protein B0H17DRAFT_676249 [Mycena rosella]
MRSRLDTSEKCVHRWVLAICRLRSAEIHKRRSCALHPLLFRLPTRLPIGLPALPSRHHSSPPHHARSWADSSPESGVLRAGSPALRLFYPPLARALPYRRPSKRPLLPFARARLCARRYAGMPRRVRRVLGASASSETCTPSAPRVPVWLRRASRAPRAPPAGASPSARPETRAPRSETRDPRRTTDALDPALHTGRDGDKIGDGPGNGNGNATYSKDFGAC